jgi:hypothetical protein
MILSTSTIEAMGFAPMRDGEVVEASFYSLHAFEVRGFTTEDGGVITDTGDVSGTKYRIAIGPSINAACRALLGDDFIDDEAAWAREHNCTPPYVLLLFGPTQSHKAQDGHTRTEGKVLVTYDLFTAAKDDITRLENTALPSIEMALACVLASRGHKVELVPVDRTVFGISPEGTTVQDLRVTGSGRAYVSQQLSQAEVQEIVTGSSALAAALDTRVARFFQLGMRDTDRLKSFLYYFLAVEIETHRTFKNFTPLQHLANTAAINGRVTVSVQQLLENRDNWTALADRFVWCVASTWVHLGDQDIEEFKRLKRIRNGIAHGDIASPDAADVVAIEALAKKVHQ